MRHALLNIYTLREENGDDMHQNPAFPIPQHPWKLSQRPSPNQALDRFLFYADFQLEIAVTFPGIVCGLFYRVLTTVW